MQPLDTPGRLFTIFLIALGVGITFYAVAALTEFFVEGRLRDVLGKRAMQQRINNMRDHIVLCGFGRFGRVVAIKRGESPIKLSPGPDHRIFAGDRVVVVGDKENLIRLEELSS